MASISNTQSPDNDSLTPTYDIDVGNPPSNIEKGGGVGQNSDRSTGQLTQGNTDSGHAGPGENNRNTGIQAQRTITGLRWFLVCFGVFSANLLYGLDTTIVADIQAAISETFDNVAQLGWLGVGLTLGSTVGILPFGKAYGIFNTKWLFVSGLTIFAAASALCGAAPTMPAMIVGRVFAGIGGAGMYLGTLNLFTSLCTPKEQPLYIGLIGFVYGGGCILGPLVGGAFMDSAATWRWVSCFPFK